MLLKIDGNAVAAEAGQSVRDLILALGMDSLALRERPLAAKIAGEVFTLNYVPVRATPGEEDSIDVRRAMAASGGEIQLLHYTDSIGKKVYTRTECFLVFWPSARSGRRRRQRLAAPWETPSMCPLRGKPIFPWLP